MPLRIRERPPKKYTVVKPRKGDVNNASTEKESMKKTSGTTNPETLQSLAKRSRQTDGDVLVGGRQGWRAPSSSEHDGKTHIQNNMNRSYESHFFQINRGHNKGSVRADKRMSSGINGSDFFR